ncbi:MAG: aldehyde ferredoxin oxidoreductase C-terminal domain-containing protein [Dethiobacteria bacterium]|jgi:aldehyde:ferredoxin oxidoreductase|nr:aldehyde ferredoxin oxidoreductase [Bacillota bacterium]
MIYRIDMNEGKYYTDIRVENKLVGGRYMVDWLTTRYMSPTAHPLSAESVFVVAPGILAGTAAPCSGRLSVGGKSPMTNGIKEANAGGTAAHKLGRLGVRALMFTGSSAEYKVLKVCREGLTLEPAGGIEMMTNYDAVAELQRRHGEHVSIILAGPAGVMKMINSGVSVTDTKGRPCRVAARGGMGAVMAAKGLKAIVVDDTGSSMRKGAREKEFAEACKAAVKLIKEDPVSQIISRFTTNGSIVSENERGGLPTFNHRAGTFGEKAMGLSPNVIMEHVKTRGSVTGHGCMPGCVLRCSTILNDEKGGYLTSGYEFETAAACGSNLGIGDLDMLLRIDRACDELGIDTMEFGATVGILNDVGLFEFGDADKVMSYLEEVRQNTPMGRIIGSGCANAAKVLGISRVPAVKGQALPYHAARPLKGYGTTYATSTQGADHTAGSVEMDMDFNLDPKGKVDICRAAQINMAFFDSAGMCMFATFINGPDKFVGLFNAMLDENWTGGDLLETGKEVLRMERAFNDKSGVGPDRLPDWLCSEPLPPTNAVFDVPPEELDQFYNF